MKYEKLVEVSDREYVYGSKPEIVAKEIINEEQYNFIQSVVPIYCVDIFAVSDNKEVLLGKRKSRPAKAMWWPSGGRKLRNELLGECASRHFKRDTGLAILTNRFVYLDHDLLIFEDREQLPELLGADTPVSLMGLKLTEEEITLVKCGGDFESLNWTSVDEILKGEYDPHVKRGVSGLFEKGFWL